jgi:CheY-like chemotaxis protein
MEERILIIDDEMFPDGNTDRKYGHLSEKDLAVQIKSFFENQNYVVEFVETGEDGLGTINKDKKETIKIILLDIRFTKKRTKMQGPEIFRKIKEIRGDIPIVVITSLPTRKLSGEDDVFKELIELGASLYVEKGYFTKRKQEQINYINALAHRENIKYVFRYNEGLDSSIIEILDIDILREEGDKTVSILKNPYRISYPMSDYLEQCAEKFPDFIHWKENRSTNIDITDIEFHKTVYKLNDAIMRSSGGRIPDFIERGGTRGCRLNPNYFQTIKMK